MAENNGTIRLNNLVKNFEDVSAVQNISLSIETGEFVTLLGPSGSGKTTTLNLIAGFELPTSGQVILGDKDVATLPSYKRNLGMVFQNYALFPHLTVAQNIAFPLKNRRLKKNNIENRVKEMLALVKLEGYENRYPKMLSGGQQQRIAIARALAYKPQALLMDEPLGALDKKLREHMQVEIKSIQEETEITVVYVTHDQEEALNLSDRIAVMNDGKIEQVGTSREIYEKPLNRFVADFIGDANMIESKVIQINGSIATIRIGDQIDFMMENKTEASKGSMVYVVVRPERIRRQANDEATEVAISGKVTQAKYIGNLISYRVDIGVSQNILLKEHNTGQELIKPGSEMRIGWNCCDSLLVE